jgi:hypothetical protein
VERHPAASGSWSRACQRMPLAPPAGTSITSLSAQNTAKRACGLFIRSSIRPGSPRWPDSRSRAPSVKAGVVRDMGERVLVKGRSGGRFMRGVPFVPAAGKCTSVHAGLASAGHPSDIGGGRLAADVSLANRVRSGRKQPQRVVPGLPVQPPTLFRATSRQVRKRGAMADSTQTELEPQAPYRVLARKYRPQTFEDLIGQDAMVRTLKNAFASGRIAQAYMLTGVRGIGKTTTARLIARALNYRACSKARTLARRLICRSRAVIATPFSNPGMSMSSRWMPPPIPVSTMSARSTMR